MSIRRVALPLALLASSVVLAAPGAVSGESRTVSLPRCTSAQLAVSAHVEGILGALVPTIELWNVSGPRCKLNRRVSLAVKTPSGEFLAIKRNPRRHTFRRGLSRHHGVFAGWGWRNWCKAPGKVTYRFTLGSRTLILRSNGRPSCNAPGSPSTLRLEGVGRLP